MADAAESTDWKPVRAGLARMTRAWDSYRAGRVPRRLAAQLRGALDVLATTVRAHDRHRGSQAALDVANATLDLQLRYRPSARVNLARSELWARQLALDARARNPGAVHGDVTTLGFIRDRIAMDSADGNWIDDQLRYLRAVAEAHEFKVAVQQAALLRRRLATVRPRSGPVS